jgi:hypothetical protein
VRPARLVRKEYADHKVIQERKVHRVLSAQLVLKGRRVLPVLQDLQALKVSKAIRVQLVRKDRKE